MADLDNLIVTFQTQLSDVMETVVKTAMYEVTRLVEDGFLEEVKRRNQEVESLRIQLQWAERKLNDQEVKDGGKIGNCVDYAMDDVEPSGDTAEQRSAEQQDDVSRDCGVKKEGDSRERWTRSCQEVIPETAQTADSPTATLTSEPQTPAEDVLPAVGVKEEEMNKPSCSSVHLGRWSSSLDGEAVPESDSAAEMTDSQPQRTSEDLSEDLLKSIIKRDPQISTAYVFPEEQERTHMSAEPSLAVDVLVSPGRDQILSSAPPTARLQNSDALGVTIKQEVILDSDVESGRKEKRMTKSGMFSKSVCSVRQHRVSSELLKQNHISHKATVQEVMKLHSKVGAGLRLQAAIQHLNRPIKKPSHSLSNSTSTTLSAAHSQAVNLNPINRIPSTSKAAPSPLSAQRGHMGDKQAGAHNRTGAQWVSIKTQLQSANSHHSNPLPHPDSHPHGGPRHLLRCGQCGKCFPHPSNLKAHLQTHTGERPFCCSLCGRSFTKLSNLKAHRRVHTGERPYCCLACGKRFTQKCNLKRHQRIHLDV